MKMRSRCGNFWDDLQVSMNYVKEKKLSVIEYYKVFFSFVGHNFFIVVKVSEI